MVLKNQKLENAHPKNNDAVYSILQKGALSENLISGKSFHGNFKSVIEYR